jgi:uncharacterized membrane protein
MSHVFKMHMIPLKINDLTSFMMMYQLYRYSLQKIVNSELELITINSVLFLLQWRHLREHK